MEKKGKQFATRNSKCVQLFQKTLHQLGQLVRASLSSEP